MSQTQGFNFQEAIAKANQVVERTSSSESKEYKYPLVYPMQGQTMVVRPLFNPASGQIVRLIDRHEKIPCYRSYGVDCPICNVMQQVRDLTGHDPFAMKNARKSRGICFAQFISSTLPIDKGGNKGVLKPGEIILMMFPWKVYSQMNVLIQSIAQTPTGMDQAFCHADTGVYVQISRSSDNQYVTTNVPYMTFTTGMTDDQFIEMLNGMESLLDQCIPATITPEVDKQVKEYADAINRQYITPRIPTTTPPNPVPQNFNRGPADMTPPWESAPQQAGPMTTGTPWVQPVVTTSTTPAQPIPSSPAVAPQTSIPSANNDMPVCFGQHQPNSPQCLCCPAEVQCQEKTGR